MITNVMPDKQKAGALKTMSEVTLQRLETTDLLKYPSNTLTDYYDVIHRLMEALAICEGIKFKGEGAHQELIKYIAERYVLGEQTWQFMEQMRVYRNRISYEGFMISKNYILLNKEKIKEIISILSRNLETVRLK